MYLSGCPRKGSHTAHVGQASGIQDMCLSFSKGNSQQIMVSRTSCSPLTQKSFFFFFIFPSYVWGDGLSSLIQNFFFFKKLTRCAKCFQPGFAQRVGLPYFSFLPPPWPVLSEARLEQNFPQIVAITWFQHLFWALSFQISLATKIKAVWQKEVL